MQGSSVSRRRTALEAAAWDSANSETTHTQGSAWWRLQGSGCAACLARRQAEGASLQWFLMENYRELPTLRALVGERFCVRHVDTLLTGANPQLAVTLEYLARVEVETLGWFRDGLTKRRHRRLRWRPRESCGLPARALLGDTAGRCPPCDAGATAALVATCEVLDLLEDVAERSAYRECDGLCRPHAWMALRESSDALADWLAADLQRRLNVTGTELNRYFAHLRGNDPKYLKDKVWARGARLLWGEGAEEEHGAGLDGSVPAHGSAP
jgi:hypothetical protein